MKTWQLLKKNPELWGRYFAKEIAIKSIRKFFENKSYHELESPILAPMLPQERYLNVIQTKEIFKQAKQTLYIIPTTERYNKLSLVAGLGNHFVVTRVARGAEQLSKNHGVEFTMLEWYEIGHTYSDIMKTTEELIKAIKKEIDMFFALKPVHNGIELVLPSTKFMFGDKVAVGDTIVSLSDRWNKYEINELFKKFLKIDLSKFPHTLEELKKNTCELNENFDGIIDFQGGFELIFDKYLDPVLDKTKPYFLYNYPSIMAPLTKRDISGMFAEKVELFIAGREIANGYSELTNGDILENNFRVEERARTELNLEKIRFDDELVEAVKAGMPEVAGIGMGLDRLIMILIGANSISEINMFPSCEWFE